MWGGVSASLFLDKCPGLILRDSHCRCNFLFVLQLYQLYHAEFPQQAARVPGSSTQAPDQLPAFFICLALATLVPWTSSYCGFLYSFLSQLTWHSSSLGGLPVKGLAPLIEF